MCPHFVMPSLVVGQRMKWRGTLPTPPFGVGGGLPVKQFAGSLMWEQQRWLAGRSCFLVTSIVADLSASRSTFGAHVSFATFAVRLREPGALRVLLVKSVKCDEKMMMKNTVVLVVQVRFSVIKYYYECCCDSNA